MQEKRILTIETQFRAEKTEKGNIIRGKPIVYEKETDLGWCREVISPDAIDEMTDISDVSFLVNHDFSMIPLARYQEGVKDSTMMLKRATDGLEIEVLLDIENNATAKQLYSAVQRKDITGMSFCFDIREQSWEDRDTDKPKRIIKKIKKIYEVSGVTLPAYKETEINARAKNIFKQEREEKLNLEKLKNQNKCI